MTVIVVGGGNAGMCAALSAREAGASVLVIERGPFHMRGGNSRHTRDIRHAHDRPDQYLTGVYDCDEFADDLRKVGGGISNPALARLLVDESAALPEWMARQGVQWQSPLQGTLQLGRTNRFLLGGGKAMLNAYYRRAEELGISVQYETTVDRVVIEEGGFKSVIVSSPGGEEEIPADAVVLAAGGFEANLEWLSRYWGEAAFNYHVRGTQYNDGMVLASLVEQGASSVGDPQSFHAVAIDARSPRFDGGIATRLDSIPFGIVVNRDAVRFHDEGEDLWPKRYAAWGGLIAGQPGQVAYSIFDSLAIGHFMPALYPAFEAASVSELAVMLQLDPARLEETLATFNCACRPGNTLDLAALDGNGTQAITPPKTNWAVPLTHPPLFAFPLHVGVTFTYWGLAVDEKARVLGPAGEPLNNVYAAGEIMSGNILERGYLAGMGLTVGSVFGRIAGTEAGSALRNPVSKRASKLEAVSPTSPVERS